MKVKNKLIDKLSETFQKSSSSRHSGISSAALNNSCVRLLAITEAAVVLEKANYHRILAEKKHER